VRQGDWKLIVNGVDHSGTRETLDPVKDKYFLVNFTRDHTETRNFSGQYPEKTRELKNLHDEWFKQLTIND